MQFKFFIGIDVSKDTLDFSVVSDGNEIAYFQIENRPTAIQAAVKRLRKIPKFTIDKALFCIEHTGIYSNHCVGELHAHKANLWVEKAIEIIRSSGMQRGKNDKVDARRIALFAYRNSDRARLWNAPRGVVVKLRKLLTIRDRLLKMKGQLTTPINESKRFDAVEIYREIKDVCQATTKAIEKDLKKVEGRIQEIVKADHSLKYLFDLATSVVGIGKVTACEIIVTTNEFKNISDSKKYACYSGVVPFEHTSGSSIRGKNRVSHFANKNIKRLLHMGALSATRVKGDLRSYWQRKLKEGKHKMVILNAIRNKLIERVFAVVNRGTKYEKNYAQRLISS